MTIGGRSRAPLRGTARHRAVMSGQQRITADAGASGENLAESTKFSACCSTVRAGDHWTHEAHDRARHPRAPGHREHGATVTVGPYPILVLGSDRSLGDAIRESLQRLVRRDFTLHRNLAPPGERRLERSDGRCECRRHRSRRRTEDGFATAGFRADRRGTPTPPRESWQGGSRTSHGTCERRPCVERRQASRDKE